ncbi:cytochrome P450 [Planococcus sp. PAMC 21323]|nr:cytochrome P450 [Planococcus sp. PAMC 21323]
MAFHDVEEMELFTLEFIKNLYLAYARLREEDPVHQVGFPDGQLG